MSAAITFDQVSKRYVLGNDPTLISRINPRRRSHLRELWALKDVSFEIAHGETVAIIGANGSGKTTTLRMMSGVSGPTSGRMEINGSVAPLIGVGVGFNPELSGRENVFVNGQLIGMSAERIKRDFDEIVAFSELERFLDTPVKYYSSGMFLRLGFAVAVYSVPEILIVDEILAVGDAAFQAKCNARMAELREAGTTVVMVTHNLNLAVRMTNRAILLDHGQMLHDGDSLEAVGKYHELLSRSRNLAGTAASSEGIASADVSVELLDEAGHPARSLESGERFTIEVEAQFTQDVDNPCVGLQIVPSDGHDVVSSVFTTPGEYKGRHGPNRPLRMTVDMTNRLLTHDYTVQAEIFDETREWLLGLSPRETFHVKAASRYFGSTDLDSVLTVEGQRFDPTAGSNA